MINFDKFYEYEKEISKEKKKDLGIVYTPLEVVDQINNLILDRWDKEVPPRVVDQSCGTGIFLWDMAHKISKRWSIPLDMVVKKYIFGCDVDESAITIARGIFKEPSNFFIMNGLDFNPALADVSVGNPPYVRIQHLDENTRSKLDEFSWCTGDTDLYVGFLQSAFENYELSGFVSSNSWMRNKSAMKMRQDVFNSQRLSYLVDYDDRKIFKGISTYCALLIFDKKSDEYVVAGQKARYQDRNSDNFFYGCKQLDFLKEVECRPQRLLDICDMKIGIATLADDVFFLPNGVSEEGYWVGENYKVELAATKPCVKASKSSIEGRIIYPYDGNKKLLTERDFKRDFPMTYQHLLSHKTKLLKRDKGKVECWYAYGRRQGLHHSAEKLLFTTFQLDPTIAECDDDAFWISGYGIYPKDGVTVEEVKSIFLSSDIVKWYKIKGKPLASGWRTINRDCLKDYRHLSQKA